MLDATPTTQRCAPCATVKPLSEFGLDRGRPSGHAPTCKQCRSKRNAGLPADALAKKRAAGRRFYVAHRDQVLAGIEAIRQRTKAADPELYRANHRLAQKRWKASNQELAKVGEKRRRDRVATDTKRAYAVKWRAENPDRSRAIGRNKESNRRATKRAAFVEPIDHAVVYARDRGVCGICQAAIAAGDKWHVDHVIPLAKGGVHSYANVQLAHARCNLRKSARVA